MIFRSLNVTLSVRLKFVLKARVEMLESLQNMSFSRGCSVNRKYVDLRYEQFPSFYIPSFSTNLSSEVIKVN